MPKKPKSDKTAKKAPKKAKKPARASYKGVTKTLRTTLTHTPLTITQMMAGLALTEDAIFYALRRLGKSKKGDLRSGMVKGLPCWWWEPDPAQAEAAPPAGKSDRPGKPAKSGKAAKAGKK